MHSRRSQLLAESTAIRGVKAQVAEFGSCWSLTYFKFGKHPDSKAGIGLPDCKCRGRTDRQTDMRQVVPIVCTYTELGLELGIRSGEDLSISRRELSVGRALKRAVGRFRSLFPSRTCGPPTRTHSIHVDHTD